MYALGSLAWAHAGAPLKIGVAGLKHGHVFTVLKLAAGNPGITLVAVAEDDPENRKEYERQFGSAVRYRNHRELLDSEQFDALVVCEEYAHRGGVAIDGLRAGKHIFSDKPLCTRIDELESIAALSAQKRLEVHVDLSLRHYWAKGAALLHQGEIGQIVNCTYAGPHGLSYSRRPRWYFEPGKHGGIINDLMGHGVDFAQWLVRRPYTEVVSATRACVGLPKHPQFETYGDAHFRMEGGATAFGRVDYLVPAGHSTPWTCFVVGTEGDAVVSGREGLVLRRANGAERRLAPNELRADSPHPFTDFVRLIADGTAPLRTTGETLHCLTAALAAQQAAETGNTGVPVPALTPGPRL